MSALTKIILFTEADGHMRFREETIDLTEGLTDDLAPKFYPVLSSPRCLDLPGWAVGATGAGAEPSA